MMDEQTEWGIGEGGRERMVYFQTIEFAGFKCRFISKFE